MLRIQLTKPAHGTTAKQARTHTLSDRAVTIPNASLVFFSLFFFSVYSLTRTDTHTPPVVLFLGFGSVLSSLFTQFVQHLPMMLSGISWMLIHISRVCVWLYWHVRVFVCVYIEERGVGFTIVLWINLCHRLDHYWNNSLVDGDVFSLVSDAQRALLNYLAA